MENCLFVLYPGSNKPNQNKVRKTETTAGGMEISLKINKLFEYTQEWKYTLLLSTPPFFFVVFFYCSIFNLNTNWKFSIKSLLGMVYGVWCVLSSFNKLYVSILQFITTLSSIHLDIRFFPFYSYIYMLLI